MSAGLPADLSGAAGLGGVWRLPRSGRLDDQLLAGTVDVGCALQQAGAGDAELVQGVLDCACVFARLAGNGWSGLARPARAGVAAGAGGGTGGGQHVAGCADYCGRLAGPGGRFGGGCGGVLVQAQQGVYVAAEGGREGAGDVHGVGQGPGGDQEPARAGRGSYPLALGVGQAGHGVAGVVGGGQRQRDIAGLRGKVVRGPGLMAGPAGQGPRRVGVGQAAGAQGEIAGLAGGGGQMPQGVGVDLGEGPGGVQPAVAGASGGVGGPEQSRAESGGVAVGGAGGQSAQEDLAVVTGHRAGGGDLAERVRGQVRRPGGLGAGHPGGVTGPLGAGDHGVVQRGDRFAAVQDGAGQGGVERDGEQQVTVGAGDRVGPLRGLHAGAEHLQPPAGAAQAASRVGGVRGPGGKRKVGAGDGDLAGERGEFAQQRPLGRRGTDDQAPFGTELPGAARIAGQVGVQQVPPGGQGYRRRIEPAGQLAARRHARRPPAAAMLPQVPGGVGERVPRGEAGAAPRGQRRAGAGPQVTRHRRDVLQVAAHHGDHVQQAAGDFLNVCCPAIGLAAGGGDAGVVAGRGQEVAERGTPGHGLLLSSPQISRALWAACRQAARSPVSGAQAAAWARCPATSWLSPATTSATRSGDSPGQGRCSAGTAVSGCPGSDGARARALRPFAADAAAITNAANRPLAGS